MANANQHAVKVLNQLIETTLDSADGYQQAAGQAASPRFRVLFEERAQRRQQLCNQLKAEVRTFGGEPEQDGTILGKSQRAFRDLKERIAGQSDKAVIDQIERGEDIILDRFERAAEDAELPHDARELVQRATSAVRADHDEISMLKHQLH
jgi:uncharacterized protein (TIGR02284 family)